MGGTIRIGIVGDYDGRPSHLATEDALRHCAAASGLELTIHWLPTESLERDDGAGVLPFDGVWCAPGSPYRSMRGALNGIRRAREGDIPFLGTCGGFQHAVIEYAQNVLGFADANHAEFDPVGTSLFVTALACSLKGETRGILIRPGTQTYRYYLRTDVVERYQCSFGLNPEYQNLLEESGCVVSGTDESGEARILELPQNRFFIATLFVPQMSSTQDHPHKLVMGFVASAAALHQSREVIR